MVISNLNIGRILELLRSMENCIQELKPFSKTTREEFLSDRRNPPFVESYLRRSLEVVFDIGRHILSKIYGFKEIEYRAIAKELAKREVVTVELSDKLSKMAGYRKRMVHFYKEVTPEEHHGIVVNELKDFDRFAKEIVAFIRAYEDKTPN
jgi:uncharacterized protein YutE (UPF0331/DUF86 family)